MLTPTQYRVRQIMCERTVSGHLQKRNQPLAATCHAQPHVTSCHAQDADTHFQQRQSMPTPEGGATATRTCGIPHHSQQRHTVSPQLPAGQCSMLHQLQPPRTYTDRPGRPHHSPNIPTALPLLPKGHHHHSPNITTALPTASSAGTAVGPLNPKP
jgi:hypothetical protein